MKNLNFIYQYGCNGARNCNNISAFKSGGKIKLMLYPSSICQLEHILKIIKENNEEFILVGNCTNILFRDKLCEKIIICTKHIKGLIPNENQIYAYCGESLTNLCNTAKNLSLWGLQDLVGIPGSVGGGIAMNCGAFESTILERINFVDYLHNGEILKIHKKDMQYGYRNTQFLMEKDIILGANFVLENEDPCKIDSRMKKVIALRKSTQPIGISLGSVFKRHQNTSAGYYIEKAGLKGMQKGGAEISEKHANFIMNKKNASSEDFEWLADYARLRVDKLFDIKLEYEVMIL